MAQRAQLCRSPATQIKISLSGNDLTHEQFGLGKNSSRKMPAIARGEMRFTAAAGSLLPVPRSPHPTCFAYVSLVPPLNQRTDRRQSHKRGKNDRDDRSLDRLGVTDRARRASKRRTRPSTIADTKIKGHGPSSPGPDGRPTSVVPLLNLCRTNIDRSLFSSMLFLPGKEGKNVR